MTDRALPPAGRAERAAWCLYDFANSSFTTVVVTFVYAVFFTRSMGPTEAIGASRWSMGIAISAVLIAVLSPVLGTMADARSAKKQFAVVFTLICIALTAGLAFVPPGAWVPALVIFVLANIAYELGIVFYNGFLPELAPPGQIGRLSGRAWGLGYYGGLLCLVLALLMIMGFPVRSAEGWTLHPLLPSGESWDVRATNLMVAMWFLLWSLPFFRRVRDRGVAGPVPGQPVLAAFSRLARTLGRIRSFRQVALFLLARLVYNDGLVAIFALGAVYARLAFGMNTLDILAFGIWLNVAAGTGAWLFGRVDDRLGGKTTILISLVGLVAASLLGLAAPSLNAPRIWLYVSGTLIGLSAGPNQAASRSLMGRFVPRRHHAEFFGFFAFSGKFTSFIGPLSFGLVTGLTGNARLGLATLLPLFLVGLLLLLLVDEREGIRVARRMDEDHQ